MHTSIFNPIIVFIKLIQQSCLKPLNLYASNQIDQWSWRERGVVGKSVATSWSRLLSLSTNVVGSCTSWWQRSRSGTRSGMIAVETWYKRGSNVSETGWSWRHRSTSVAQAIRGRYWSIFKILTPFSPRSDNFFRSGWAAWAWWDRSPVWMGY